MTKRQQEILDFVKGFIRDNQYPPTRTEISEAFGFKSTNAAEDHLRALERKGLVKLVANIQRGIVVL